MAKLASRHESLEKEEAMERLHHGTFRWNPLDEWFEKDVKPCLKGQEFLVRYADDFVMDFACARDARRVLDVLPKRFGKYGLTIHADKKRLMPFVRPTSRTSPPGQVKWHAWP
jgi:hypothetical protein